MNEKQLKRLIEMQKAMDGGAIQPDELKQVVELIFDVIKELKKRLEFDISTGDSEIAKVCNAMMTDMIRMEEKTKEMIKESSKKSGAEFEKGLKSVIDELEKIKDTIPSMPDLSVYDAKLSEIEAKIPIIKDTILDTPEQIRDKLESIEKESEKLSILAISELRKELDDLKKEISRAGSRGGLSFGGRVGVQLLNNGTKVGTRAGEINFGAGFTLYTMNGMVNVVSTLSDSVVTVSTGTIDDSNVTFTVASEPSVAVINGAGYLKTGGAITWSYSSGTITLSSPVGVGGAIFFLK